MLVMKVKIVKEVMTCDVLPVAMFLSLRPTVENPYQSDLFRMMMLIGMEDSFTSRIARSRG